MGLGVLIKTIFKPVSDQKRTRCVFDLVGDNKIPCLLLILGIFLEHS